MNQEIYNKIISGYYSDFNLNEMYHENIKNDFESEDDAYLIKLFDDVYDHVYNDIKIDYIKENENINFLGPFNYLIFGIMKYIDDQDEFINDRFYEQFRLCNNDSLGYGYRLRLAEKFLEAYENSFDGYASVLVDVGYMMFYEVDELKTKNKQLEDELLKYKMNEKLSLLEEEFNKL